MTEEQIKHMVSRFLSWKLPEHFRPDAGISFEPAYNTNTPWPMKHQPVGTNLFSADQATVMVLHMLEGIPPADGTSEALERAIDFIESLTADPLLMGVDDVEMTLGDVQEHARIELASIRKLLPPA